VADKCPASLGKLRGGVFMQIQRSKTGVIRRPHRRQAYRFGSIIASAPLIFVFCVQDASGNAMTVTPACQEKQNYSAMENKIHLAVCRGESIVLGPAETIAATVLAREITDNADLDELKSRGFVMKGGIVLGKFELRGRHFEMPIFQISSVFDDLVDFSDSQFSGSVNLQGSAFRKGILATRVVVGGSLMAGDSDDAQYDGKREAGGSPIMFIGAAHARVGGDVVISGATLNEELDISNSQISGSVTIMYVAAGRIDLSASDFGNQLIFYNCAVGPNGVSAGDSSDLNLFSIRTKQSVFINRVSIKNDISLSEAEIDGDVILLGTQLSSMNGRSANVSGTLSLGLHDDPPAMWTRWTNKSTLDLTNARLGGIRSPERLDVWPKSIWFHNLSFKSFSADFCGAPSCQHNSSWYGQWLSTQAGERKSFEPYKEVIDLLMAQGEVLEALDLGVLGHDVEREDAYRHGEFIRHILLSVYRYTVGYGYKLYWVVYSILFFVIAGAVIFRQTPEARRRHMPFGLFYSFDMLLPIIRLRDSHYKIDLKGDARYYFYFHKLVGWALGATLIAALSGIAK
jgi:hypothetical protein